MGIYFGSVRSAEVLPDRRLAYHHYYSQHEFHTTLAAQSTEHSLNAKCTDSLGFKGLDHSKLTSGKKQLRVFKFGFFYLCRKHLL